MPTIAENIKAVMAEFESMSDEELVSLVNDYEILSATAELPKDSGVRAWVAKYVTAGLYYDNARHIVDAAVYRLAARRWVKLVSLPV